jgi:hypothetical protein
MTDGGQVTSSDNGPKSKNSPTNNTLHQYSHS